MRVKTDNRRRTIDSPERDRGGVAGREGGEEGGREEVRGRGGREGGREEGFSAAIARLTESTSDSVGSTPEIDQLEHEIDGRNTLHIDRSTLHRK